MHKVDSIIRSNSFPEVVTEGTRTGDVHSIEDVSWLVQTYKIYGRIPGAIDDSNGDSC